MNKAIAIIGVGLLAVVGYMVWSSNSTPAYQTPPPAPAPTPVPTTTTTTTTTTTVTKAGSPLVKTTSASAITNSGARLNATVNPNGASTTYWFEYSGDSLLSAVLVSSTSEQSLAASYTTANVSANIANLNKNTKYYYRIAARNQYGTIRGSIESFTTKP